MNNDLKDTLLCLGCACFCEDALSGNASELHQTVGTECPLVEGWIEQQREPKTGCNIAGVSVSLSDAISHIQNLLADSKAPLFCGFDSLVTENQRRLFKLARKLGGYVDWTTGQHQIDSLLSLQRAGHVGCTLGEIKNRADLIVVWDFDVEKVAPRFTERFVRTENIVEINSAGIQSRDRRSKNMVNVDNRLTLLTAMKLRLSDRLKSDETIPAVGFSVHQVDELLAAIKQSNYCVFVVHSGESKLDAIEHEQLTKLIMQLNLVTQVRLMDLAIKGNSRGAENVSTWLTGFPLGVKLSPSKAAEYNPFHFSTRRLIENEIVDLIISYESTDTPQELGNKNEHAISKIEIGGCPSQPENCTVQIPTLSDFRSGGTVFRGDGVPLLIASPEMLISGHHKIEDVLVSLDN